MHVFLQVARILGKSQLERAFYFQPSSLVLQTLEDRKPILNLKVFSLQLPQGFCLPLVQDSSDLFRSLNQLDIVKINENTMFLRQILSQSKAIQVNNHWSVACLHPLKFFKRIQPQVTWSNLCFKQEVGLQTSNLRDNPALSRKLDQITPEVSSNWNCSLIFQLLQLKNPKWFE